MIRDRRPRRERVCYRPKLQIHHKRDTVFVYYIPNLPIDII